MWYQEQFLPELWCRIGILFLCAGRNACFRKERYAMKRSYRRNPGMEKINHVIPKSIHALGKKIERMYQEHFVLARWQEIVGAGIAAHVWPLAVEGDELILYAAAPAWRNEIMLMQLMILARFNNIAGFEMVKKIRFSWQKSDVWRRAEKNDSSDMDDTEGQEAYRKALQEMQLTEEEQEACTRSIASVGNPALREKLLHLFEKRRKSEKARKAAGDAPCPHCGRLVAGGRLCLACAMQAKKEKRRLLRRLLLDLPWARYAEIQEHIPCTPAMVASERSRLSQELARRIKFGDWESLEAKTLVMLYRSLRPEQLTEEIVRRTLYDLRHEMAEGTVFSPFPKRSDFMKKRVKTAREGKEGADVSASRR